MNFAIRIASIVLLLAYAQVMLKWRLDRLPPLKLNSWNGLKSAVFSFFDPFVFSCFMAIGVASVMYILVLSKYHLSFLFPFMSLNFIMVMIGGCLFLGEPFNWFKVTGALTITAGVAIAAQGMR